MPAKPKIPSGKEIYDGIMREIEPDLVYENLGNLAKAHENEIPEAKKERMKRYSRAFKEYKKQYKAFMETLHREVQAYKKQAVKFLESQSGQKETVEMNNLESLILGS